MNTYGVINRNEVHIDVSKSQKGAKQYATRHGYNKVSLRVGYSVVILAEKNKSGKWIKYSANMTPDEIINDLEQRGERNIIFREDGTIVSFHGKSTINYWYVIDAILICYDCKTID